MPLITLFFKPLAPDLRTLNRPSNQVSAPLISHVGAGGSPSSSSTRMVPPPSLPVELVSHIIKELPRTDLPSVHATSRVCTEIARALLFKYLSYSSVHGIEISLMSVAQTPELADLVRSLHVYIGLRPPQEPQQLDEIVSIVPIALGHFLKLETFKFKENLPNGVLKLAILSHPSLQTLFHELWHSSLTPYNFSFQRTTRPRPLIIEAIRYSEGYRADELSPQRFYGTVFPYISHHQLHVRSLDLASIRFDGYPLPLLLSNPIPGLVSFTITYFWPDPLPLILSEAIWLSTFISSSS